MKAPLTAQQWLALWDERMHNYAHLAMSTLHCMMGYEPLEPMRRWAGEDFPKYRRRWELAFWHYQKALERVREEHRRFACLD